MLRRSVDAVILSGYSQITYHQVEMATLPQQALSRIATRHPFELDVG
jgi:hypothetical protein